jgi:raffinose/stachyose/melibiose transport system substrate-binding protein
MEVIGELEGMNNWLDTELHADIARVYLDGSQALLEGTKTPEQVLKEVQEAGRIVRETLGSN